MLMTLNTTSDMHIEDLPQKKDNNISFHSKPPPSAFFPLSSYSGDYES